VLPQLSADRPVLVGLWGVPCRDSSLDYLLRTLGTHNTTLHHLRGPSREQGEGGTQLWERERRERVSLGGGGSGHMGQALRSAQLAGIKKLSSSCRVRGGFQTWQLLLLFDYLLNS
jgi:hypothetical protein